MNSQVRELRKTVEQMGKQMKKMCEIMMKMSRNGGGSVIVSTSNVKMHKS